MTVHPLPERIFRSAGIDHGGQPESEAPLNDDRRQMQFASTGLYWFCAPHAYHG
jgi:hypothetical protein